MAEKALLVLQSKANRLSLAAEWERFRTPETWIAETSRLARRHPIWTAVLAVAVGALTKSVGRKPEVLSGGFGRIGKVIALAITLWKLLRRKNPAKDK